MKSIMFLGVNSKTFRLTTDIKLESLHEYVHKRLQCNFHYDVRTYTCVFGLKRMKNDRFSLLFSMLSVVVGSGSGKWVIETLDQLFFSRKMLHFIPRYMCEKTQKANLNLNCPSLFIIPPFTIKDSTVTLLWTHQTKKALRKTRPT